MYVYFVQARSGGPIKIGKADRPDRRLESLQPGNPEELVVLGVLKGGHAAERRLHFHFNEEAIGREWFECSPRLLDFAKRLPSWESVHAGGYCPELLGTIGVIVYELYKLGYSFRDIGELFRFSPQRAQQLIEKPWQGDNESETNGHRLGKMIRNQERPTPTEPIEAAFARIQRESEGLDIVLPE